MKYVDEFRKAAAVESVLDALRRRATRRWTVMEVCGGQTHGLLRYGFDAALADCVDLVHGPGCPVCVTAEDHIDRAIQLARRGGIVVASFGDMLRVPGSGESLAEARAAGAQVRAVYSPLDALALAAARPAEQVVFFAVGFETTAPATALAIQQARRRGLTNFSLLSAHVRVQPAMEAVVAEPDARVQAFLAAGHVAAVVGYQSYAELCRRRRIPVVVTGFEPLDLALGLRACVEQLETGRYAVENQYGRVVRPEGNVHARRLVDEVFEPCDREWRGLGTMPLGGLRLRRAWREFDAEQRFAEFPLPVLSRPAPEMSPAEQREAGKPRLPSVATGSFDAQTSVTPTACRAGDVLSGRLKPRQCEAFGTRCTPEHPLGAPMVSGEGACAAYYFYHPRADRDDPGSSTV